MLALNGAAVGRVFDAAAAAKNNPCFPLRPDYCPCSAGCTTTACPRCEGPKVGAGTWHAIAQFAGRGWHIPKNITGRLRYF